MSRPLSLAAERSLVSGLQLYRPPAGAPNPFRRFRRLQGGGPSGDPFSGDDAMFKVLIVLGVVLLVAWPALRAAEPAPARNADVAAVVKGNNQFAFDLYGQLRKKDGNPFLP
jgi:hypothetical protein